MATAAPGGGEAARGPTAPRGANEEVVHPHLDLDRIHTRGETVDEKIEKLDAELARYKELDTGLHLRRSPDCLAVGVAACKAASGCIQATWDLPPWICWYVFRPADQKSCVDLLFYGLEHQLDNACLLFLKPAV